MSIFLLDFLDEPNEDIMIQMMQKKGKHVQFNESVFVRMIEKRHELYFNSEATLWYGYSDIANFRKEFEIEMRNVMKMLNVKFKEAKIFLYYIAINIDDDDFDEIFFY
jgi:hypothetical protein